MDSGKVREWTIQSPTHFNPVVVSHLEVSDGPILPSFLKNYDNDSWKIRVIEKSAYDSVVAERDELNQIVSDLRSGLAMYYQPKEVLRSNNQKLREENNELRARVAELEKPHGLDCPYPDCGRPFAVDLRPSEFIDKLMRGTWFVGRGNSPVPPKYKELEARIAKASEALLSAHCSLFAIYVACSGKFKLNTSSLAKMCEQECDRIVNTIKEIE